jgi:UDP-N-acetylglucosamine acyltransferase
MGSVLNQDVPPYVIVSGHPARPRGINSEGLRRRSFTPASIQAIKRAYRALYLAGLSRAAALDRLRELAVTAPDIMPLLEFISASTRGLVR